MNYHCLADSFNQHHALVFTITHIYLEKYHSESSKIFPRTKSRIQYMLYGQMPFGSNQKSMNRRNENGLLISDIFLVSSLDSKNITVNFFI